MLCCSKIRANRGVGSTFKLGGPITSRALAWWKGYLTIGVRATFFFGGGGGAESLLPNFRGAEFHKAPPWLAPSEKILNI